MWRREGARRRGRRRRERKKKKGGERRVLWGSVGFCGHVKSQQTVQFENVIDGITKDKVM